MPETEEFIIIITLCVRSTTYINIYAIINLDEAVFLHMM